MKTEVPLPLYYKVMQSIQEKIINKEYKSDEAIPSATDLAKIYDVSAITIRRAIKELADEGYLATRRGKRTVVTQPNTYQQISARQGWGEVMRAQGIDSKITRLSIETKIMSPEISRLLELKENKPITRIERLRCVNDEPYCYMINYLLSEKVIGIEKEDLYNNFLYPILQEKYGFIIYRCVDKIEAIVSDKETSGYLQVKNNTPIMKLIRMEYDVTGVPLGMIQIYSRTDKYAYVVITENNRSES